MRLDMRFLRSAGSVAVGRNLFGHACRYLLNALASLQHTQAADLLPQLCKMHMQSNLVFVTQACFLCSTKLRWEQIMIDKEGITIIMLLMLWSWENAVDASVGASVDASVFWLWSFSGAALFGTADITKLSYHQHVGKALVASRCTGVNRLMWNSSQYKLRWDTGRQLICSPNWKTVSAHSVQGQN